MQKKRVSRILQKTIPAFHTFLIQQNDVCEKIKISLLFGSAQINGIQLKSKYPHFYTVPCSIPIYTWQGAQIQIQWTQYQNTKNQMVLVDITEQNKMETPMLKYFQIHYNFILLRRYAFEQLKLGPRIGIVGTDQTAAQNVSRLLLNWSGKLNMNPVFVDLDPQSSFFVDGSIGAMQFQYKIAQDLFDRSKKITLYYGNRSIRSKSYLEQVKLLANSVSKKIQKQSYDYKLHGSKEQFPSFTAGLIIQFPKAKAKQNKKQHAMKIKQIIKIFDCTHVINVGFQELQHVMNDPKSQIQYIKSPPLQGTQSFLSLSRPLKSKIQRYLLNQSVLIKYPIAEIKIYELMTQKKSLNQPTLQQRPYCRPINIRQQTISKNTIAFLSGTLQQGKLDQFGLYKKAMVCSVLGLGRIYSINENQVTFQVGHQNILYELKDHIWVTSVNDQ